MSRVGLPLQARAETRKEKAAFALALALASTLSDHETAARIGYATRFVLPRDSYLRGKLKENGAACGRMSGKI